MGISMSAAVGIMTAVLALAAATFGLWLAEKRQRTEAVRMAEQAEKEARRKAAHRAKRRKKKLAAAEKERQAQETAKRHEEKKAESQRRQQEIIRDIKDRSSNIAAPPIAAGPVPETSNN